MIKKAFRMKVFPDQHAEYEKRHKELWPEMRQMLKEHGVLSYSIFLDKETSFLFAYAEIENEEQWKQITKTEINQRWWEFMEPIMETNPDKSPVSHELPQVFEL